MAMMKSKLFFFDETFRDKKSSPHPRLKLAKPSVRLHGFFQNIFVFAQRLVIFPCMLSFFKHFLELSLFLMIIAHFSCRREKGGCEAIALVRNERRRGRKRDLEIQEGRLNALHLNL